MYQLLLDSSNKYLTVALSKDGKLFDKIFYEAWQRQSEVMVSEINNILKRNNLVKDDLSAVVVGIGPGSYTGVRIAITIAKIAAYVLKIKLYKVSSLSLLRYGDKPTICLFNARGGRCYFAVYEGNKIVKEDSILTNEEVLSFINEHPSFIVAGDSYVLSKESAPIDIATNLSLAIREENLVSDIFSLNPIYLKDLLK